MLLGFDAISFVFVRHVVTVRQIGQSKQKCKLSPVSKSPKMPLE